MSEAVMGIADLIPLHEEAVIQTIVVLLKLDTIRGVEVRDYVHSIYKAMPTASAILMCHEEPFDTACDFANLPLEKRATLFTKLREGYENLLGQFDELAEIAFQKPNPDPNAGSDVKSDTIRFGSD